MINADCQLPNSCAIPSVLRSELAGVSEVPITGYATTSDGGSVAYQISGEGPLDLLVLGAATGPLDVLWEEPGLVRARNRLGAFSRTVWLEQRGYGASDRDVGPVRGVEEDIRETQLTAVADAVGAERFALLAFWVMGPWAIRYAVNHPERVSALIVFDSFASYIQDDECPWGMPLDVLDRIVERTAETWGTGFAVDFMAPSRKNDDRFREWVARGERLGASPSYAGERLRARYLQDVRTHLGALRVPTLVMHRRDDAVVRVEAGRHLAQHINGAKYVELQGADGWFFVGDSDAVVDEIQEFLTGIRTGADGDMVVSTVLFTDIVDSTDRSVRLGHRAWSTLNDEHDARVRKALARHGGREIKTLGDGFLATFDSAGRAVRCAAEVASGANDIGLAVRAGVHTGEVEFRGGDVTGLAVTIGKRVCDLAASGQVLVTETVRGATVGSSVELDDAGQHSLKGVPGTWHLHSLRT